MKRLSKKEQDFSKEALQVKVSTSVRDLTVCMLLLGRVEEVATRAEEAGLLGATEFLKDVEAAIKTGRRCLVSAKKGLVAR